jgi:hypothetical protein
MKFVVQRQKPDATATMGELFIEGIHQCFTLEPAVPIPAGTYELIIYPSPHFKRLMPLVSGVPGHTGVEIHWGNWASDTEDCTLVGTVENGDFVGHSVEEFNILFQIIQDAVNSGPQTITYLDPEGMVNTPLLKEGA